MTVARSGLPWSASSGHKSGCFLKLGMLRFIPPMLFVTPSRSRHFEGNDRIWNPWESLGTDGTLMETFCENAGQMRTLVNVPSVQ